MPGGRVLLRFERAWQDGTHGVLFDPLDFIARLVALIPPSRFHMTRYHGVLAVHAKARVEVVPEPEPVEPRQLHLALVLESPAESKSSRHPWAYLLERVEHLLISASAGFNQTIWVFDNDAPGYELCFANDCYGSSARGLGHLIRVGPELRVGWTRRWWMAWALAGAHVGLSRVRLSCDNSLEARCDRGETDVGGGLGGGLGVAIRPLPRFAVGLESGIVHTWLDRRDDPFAAARTWELALVAVIGF